MVLEQPLDQPLEYSRVLPNMEVVGADAQRVGFVKDVREDDFLVDRTRHRDVYIPLGAVERIQDDVVVLAVNADRIDDMEWAKPPLMG